MAKVLSYFSKRPSAAIKCPGIGAQQHFKNECDLNQIIKKYPDGVVPPPAALPNYGDFTAIGKGLQESMEAFRFVSDWFSALPSETRARFDNDPLAAQRFILEHDPKESAALGLCQLKEAPKAQDGAAVIAAEKGGVAAPSPTAPATDRPGGTTEGALS